jgi:hypothetical protein
VKVIEGVVPEGAVPEGGVLEGISLGFSKGAREGVPEAILEGVSNK